MGVADLLSYMAEWRRVHGGVTEEALAGQAEIAAGTFSAWRHRQSQPRPATLRKLAAAMQVPETDLFRLAGYASAQGDGGEEELSPMEREWLKMLRETRPDLRQGVLAMLQEFHRQSQAKAQ